MRVLQVFGEPISFGGQETFAINVYEAINKEKVQFDFFTPYYCNNDNMKSKIENMGGKVYASNKKFDTKKRKKYFVDELNNFLNNNEYDIVHINSGSTFVLACGAEIAKKHNVKKVIVHSHSKGVFSVKYLIVKILTYFKFIKNVDEYLACSDEAAKWKFPRTIINKKKYSVIKNGINIEKYVFNQKIREEYRKEFNIGKDTLVLGHVGRMEFEKNHLFILDVFSKLNKKNPKSKLILVGNGTLENEIKEKIENLNLTSKVILFEKRNDINNVLQVMDAFIFPSIYEGLGIAIIEAQASGLKAFASENIPEAANVTKNFIKIDLALGSDYWAEKILNESEKYSRKNMASELYKYGYDVNATALDLEKIYLE